MLQSGSGEKLCALIIVGMILSTPSINQSKQYVNLIVSYHFIRTKLIMAYEVTLNWHIDNNVVSYSRTLSSSKWFNHRLITTITISYFVSFFDEKVWR